MSEHHYSLDTTTLTNERHYITATMTDDAGAVTMTAVVMVVNNPTSPQVALDILSATGLDPIDLRYRAGDSGKKTNITVDSKLRGHVRVNGVVQP